MKNSIRIAELIRKLRISHGISRGELAEMIRVSESHLNKIEAGSRRPGIDTFERILDAFSAEIVLKTEPESFREECLQRIQQVLEDSTDRQVIFLTNTLVQMSKELEKV